MKVSFDQVIVWAPCAEYQKDGGARLLELYPSKEADLIDVLRDERIPVEDRVWLGCHALPWETIQPVVEGWVERAIRRCLGKSGVPEWETWAEKWLSGKDQTVAVAKKAAAWRRRARAADAAVWVAARARATGLNLLVAAAEEAATAAGWASVAGAEAWDVVEAAAAARTAWAAEAAAEAAWAEAAASVAATWAAWAARARAAAEAREEVKKQLEEITELAINMEGD